VIQLREEMSLALEDLHNETKFDSLCIATKCNKWLQKAVSRRKVAFMRELMQIVPTPDFKFLVDHVFGLPKVGWAFRAPAGTPRLSPPRGFVGFPMGGFGKTQQEDYPQGNLHRGRGPGPSQLVQNTG
jgi:hypothetical protein